MTAVIPRRQKQEEKIMPLPAILITIATISAAIGTGAAVKGGIDMKNANDRMNEIKKKVEEAKDLLETQNQITASAMDNLGTYELKILKSFEDFTKVFDKINNITIERVQLKDAELLKYDRKELNDVAIGAGVAFSALGSAALGTAGGFAAAGAATAAMAALGTASTGVAISSLSGAAATNAILAALGGGALAVGGGGMALGSIVLGVGSAGIGLLIGGIIFAVAGASLSGKVDEAEKEGKEIVGKIEQALRYLLDLKETAERYDDCLHSMNTLYKMCFNRLKTIVSVNGKTDWNDFTNEEKRTTENALLLVNLLHKMCQVKLVLCKNDEINAVNSEAVESAIAEADRVCNKFMQSEGVVSI